MFRALGACVTRIWPFLLIIWVLLLAVVWLKAPPWQEVAQDQQFGLLPADVPSRVSGRKFAEAFPDERLASSVVLVIERPEGQSGSTDREQKFIEDVLEPGLRQIADEEGGLASEPKVSDEEPDSSTNAATPAQDKQEPIIARIRTPNAPGTGPLLISDDDRALLVVVELTTTEFLSRLNWPVISKIEDLISGLKEQGKLPPGDEIYLTGSAVIGRDHNLAQLQSARATETLTITLVIVLLVLIYRAPFLALIPLATVFVAVQLAVHALALLAKAGYVRLFAGIEIYITVLSYGAGVDYCLFLISRYKEELDAGASARDGLAGALGKVGAALAASAGTVMCGIAMMWFASFGKFHEAGIAIPFSLIIVLAATLTFSPALLRLAGRWAFWPRSVANNSQGGQAAGPAQPGALERGWVHLGEFLLRRPGAIWLATFAVLAPFALVAVVLYNFISYDLTSGLPSSAPSVAGTRVLQNHFPGGTMSPITVLLVNPNVDFKTQEGRALVEQLTDRLKEEKDSLGLVDVRSLTAPLGITRVAQNALAVLDLPTSVVQREMQQQALEQYASDFGERKKIGTRLDLILKDSPFARASIDNLKTLEQAVRDSLPAGLQEAELYFMGATPSLFDLKAVVERDRVRIEILVLAVVFLILVVLLRQFVVSLYLILSVLFSYFATLGLTFAVFWLLDPHNFAGIDWKVTIFLFTILIAVGEDYNIFIMTRIHEEQERHGALRGITEALVRTGPIISSAGVIMAGTFASLLAGSLTEMKELGFALAFGVLLDTFVVRPILVPAFLILLERHWHGRKEEPVLVRSSENYGQ
jgi:RND superfamily putative drug exporter